MTKHHPPKLFMLAIYLAFPCILGCGSQPKQPNSYLHLSQPLDDTTPGSASLPSQTELDQLILARQEKNLATLQNHPYHKGKPLMELQLLAKVGKQTKPAVIDTIKKAIPQTTLDLDKASSLYREYQRIWYLADEAYRPISRKKFDPTRRLIPYMTRVLDPHLAGLLYPVFRFELDKESKDPRALGHECSEMFKLQTIVDHLNPAFSAGGFSKAQGVAQ